MRRQLRLNPGICFAVGVLGALLNVLGGVLMMANVGPALYAQTAAFACIGVMLLGLGVTEKGPDKTTRRTKLLLVFLLLVVGMLPLPLLDVVAAAVLPLMMALYYRQGSGPCMLALCLAECGYAVVHTLALVPRLVGGNALLAVGIAAVCVGLVRGAVLLRLRALSES